VIAGVVLVSLASGCASSSWSYGSTHQKRELAGSAALLGVTLAAALVYGLFKSDRRDSRRHAPPAPYPPLTGQVRWEDSHEGPPLSPVSLRADEGSAVVQTATPDASGRFELAFPRKPGWYTLSVNTDSAEGKTTVWLQDRPPAALEVLVRRR
jgi:hypothetical protein